MNLTDVKVIAKTRFSERAGVVTFVATLPRCLLPELATHRLFSKNAASSRAVPIAQMIERVKKATFVPTHWRTNQRGMVGGAYLDRDHQAKCVERWLKAAERAMQDARFFADMSVHKGIANRVLEPFSYTEVLITSRIEALPHFLNLRNDPDAEDHFRDLAGMVEQRVAATPFQFGWRHVPYVSQEESAEHGLAQSLRVSAVRCRRVSYFKLGGEHPSWKEDLKQAEEMIAAPVMHASPFEHPCFKASHPVRPFMAGNLALPDEQEVDFHQFRKQLTEEFMMTRKVRTV